MRTNLGICFVCILALSLSGGFFSSVTAIPSHHDDCVDSASSVETDHADINAIVRQPTNRSDVVQIEYRILTSDADLSVDLPTDVQVVRASGFRRDSDSRELTYTGSDRAVIEYRIGVSGAQSQYANGNNWIFAPTPTHIGNTGVDLELKPNGVVANDFLYLGNFTRHTTTIGCHDISLVNAKAGNLDTNPDQILRALEYTANEFNVGFRYDQTTIFLTPGFAHGSNLGFAKTSDAWVTKSTSVDPEYSVTRGVIHEYIHTRQAFTRGSIGGMGWVTEGSADYYSYKYGRELGVISNSTYNEWLHNGSKIDAVLSNRSTWESKSVEYNRGGAFMAILDQRIQANSNHSLVDVFHRINSNRGRADHVLVQRSIFLRIVENKSTDSARWWADRAMDSADPYNVSLATVDTSEDKSFGDSVAVWIQEDPIESVVVAGFFGCILGMLPYELRREFGDNNSNSSEGEVDEEDENTR
jgi:hypothetical protein